MSFGSSQMQSQAPSPANSERDYANSYLQADSGFNENLEAKVSGSKRRAPRHSKTPSGEFAKPTQLNFYPFAEREVLTHAKNLFEITLCLIDPFPNKVSTDKYAQEAIHQANQELRQGKFCLDCTMSLSLTISQN